ncbi:TnsA endonuclease N-terminal domain-containing protein [Hymenobacter metallilatus]|uniref:Heteromeric transposase endonuclease subunit TnsA n=1 Tax=Hymenobacter metallilatus TaxID=2493666 RepID=A0A428IXT7_9BACT|nr:TnsA endonuclease N-terminal domain-containing protein [Hymenobacter metallilatus]RSK23864.1 heteromeric transposase endonuclease subunit TnsA [Hymenobacter metallilatus]
MPVRNIPLRYSSVAGVVPSKKMKRLHEFESTLERDLIALLEFDRNVQAFEEQPVCIEFQDETGKLRSYTPDMLIHYRSDRPPGMWLKPRLIEVKYRSTLWAEWPTLRPKFRAAVRYAAMRGWEFKILTEKEIRTQYLENVRFLNRYRWVEVELGYVHRLQELLGLLPSTTPAELIQLAVRDAYKQAEYLFVLWHMVALGMVGIELTHTLTMQTPIWPLTGQVPAFTQPFRRL